VDGQSDGQVTLVSSEGQMIRVKVKEISETGRVASGVILMKVDANERVVAMEYTEDGASEGSDGNGDDEASGNA
jgi:DNA gyrase/topoisomerase IV subunit A